MLQQLKYLQKDLKKYKPKWLYTKLIATWIPKKIWIKQYLSMKIDGLFITTDLLHISDLILKSCFYTSNRSYFPYKRQNVTCSSTSKQKDKEFEYNFLIICNYLNLPKKNFRGQFFGKK